jgi:hypothetical protein
MANPEHKDTLDCAKRDGGPLYGPDGIEPVGFTGKPCKCKLWRQIYQHEDTATAGPPRLIEGCRFDLELYIQATILRKCNHAASMAIAANKQTQELRRDIGTLVQLTLPADLRQVVIASMDEGKCRLGERVIPVAPEVILDTLPGGNIKRSS